MNKQLNAKFFIYQSNRLEILAEKLAENLGQNPLPPLQEEIIIVQSKAMQEYISLLLARKIGICAQVSFPFPVLFTYQLFRNYFPSLPEEYPFAQEILFWKILDILPSFKNEPEARILKDYAPSNLELGHIQLAENLAYLFDQYVIFRPEMILHWDQGQCDYFKNLPGGILHSGAVFDSIPQDQQEHERWQARLWQNISQGNEQEHRAALKERFKQAIKENPQNLPERISIFGISSLPLYYLDIFYTLSHFCQVHVYIQNPCQIYWGDNPGPKARTPFKEDYQANDLLVSWGKPGRDFLDSFYTFDLQFHEWEEFISPGRDTLLHCIQDDILKNENPGPDRHLLSPDKSITIRSCHSPMREVEVLKDYIYYILKNNPDIQPDDILVVTPNIEIYTPYIQAVFDKTENPNQRLPYTIAEKKLAYTEASQALLAILDLLQSRFEASKVLSVLEKSIIYQKFGLTASDLELITHWVRQVHIFWGLNSQHKKDLNLPPHYQNTWEFGLHRLFLGLVLPGDNWTLFYRPDKGGPPILPYPDVEGETANALSSLAQFISLLHNLYTEIKKPHNIQQWEKILQHILDNFLAQESESMESEDFSIQVLNLREQIISLTSRAAKTAEFKGAISLPGLIHILKQHLSPKNIEYGDSGGSIIFCSMLAMRSIPKKVICMLGLNDSAFPREDKRPNFDLIFACPQKGDRSIRNDDRYLFLEALLSARDYLFISYVGQSLEDNSEIPPSVLVSELLDYVQKYYEFERQDEQAHGTDENINLIVRDRLQPFHPRWTYWGSFQRHSRADILRTLRRQFWHESHGIE
jgi:exodeoxyribonuclease V gamma subunit